MGKHTATGNSLRPYTECPANLKDLLQLWRQARTGALAPFFPRDYKMSEIHSNWLSPVQFPAAGKTPVLPSSACCCGRSTFRAAAPPSPCKAAQVAPWNTTRGTWGARAWTETLEGHPQLSIQMLQMLRAPCICNASDRWARSLRAWQRGWCDPRGTGVLHPHGLRHKHLVLTLVVLIHSTD